MKLIMIKCSRYMLITGMLLITVGTVGCDSSSSGGASVAADVSSLNDTVKNIPLSAGVPLEHTFSYDISAGTSGGITERGDYAVNVAKTLENMTLSNSPIADSGSRLETLRLLAKAVIRNAFAAESAQIVVHISYRDDPDVCSSPFMLGPYTITGAVGENASSDTGTVAPTPMIADLMNGGSFEVCVKTTPPINGFVSVEAVAMEYEPCAPVTASFEGAWSGIFSCYDYDDIPIATNASVTLTVRRNADGSYFFETGDKSEQYTGHACGNKLKFEGGTVSGVLTESGTLVVNGDAATRTSNYHDNFGYGDSGYCQATLQRD